MQSRTAVILWLTLFLVADVFSAPPAGIIKTDIVTISIQQQHSFVNPYSKSAFAIHFQLEKNWRFYASSHTAPGGMNLKIKTPKEGLIGFSEPIFPLPQMYFDKALGKRIEVFSDNFTVYLPFTVADIKTASTEDMIEVVKIGIEGAVCSDIQCRVPNFGNLSTDIRISFDTTMGKAKFTIPDLAELVSKDKPVVTNQWVGYSAWFAFALALLAGLSLNIMPCVWPVLPLIVMRIVESAKQGKSSSIMMGLAFCSGILLFFAALAGANIILHVVYGTVLQWGDQFRNPVFVAGTALLLVILALFMFGVFNISVPSSIAAKSGSGKGLAGSVGMGFLAAVLSTPCSFGILAAAFAWAQTQPWPSATIAIMMIGIGMAVPYLILTSMPQLLKNLPKSGRWMELFKQAVGFVLLAIAVWLVSAIPQSRRMNILYFAVALGFCTWMWGSWASYDTKAMQKWLIRIIAIVLTVVAGWVFLPERKTNIDWQSYDADLIEIALSEERPVLIKFTASWCLSCKVVDKVVYSRKDVARLLEEKNVLTIKADTTTKDSPATHALKNIYNEPGIPVSMLFLPGKREPHRWRGKSFADELSKLLEKLPSK